MFYYISKHSSTASLLDQLACSCPPLRNYPSSSSPQIWWQLVISYYIDIMIKFSSGYFKDFDKFNEYRKFAQKRSIGIFDSGIGGLSILRYLGSILDDKQNKSNNKDIIYVADTGRFPYGTKSPQEIFTYSEQIIKWLEQKNVELIIFGCNTANAIISNRLKEITKLPVLDLIDPVAKYVSTSRRNVGVIATAATVNSRAYSKTIKLYSPDLHVSEIAAAELVNIIEKGNINSKETNELLSNYAQQFSSAGVGSIILGCTHFSFIKDYLSPLVQNEVQILDPAELIVSLITEFSSDDDQLTGNISYKNNVGRLTFFVTGDRDAFALKASTALGYSVSAVNSLSIDALESYKSRK